MMAGEVISIPTGTPARLGLWRDDDLAWRRLAWANAICALTLLAAAVPLARSPSPEKPAPTVPVLTPVELVLTPPVAAPSAEMAPANGPMVAASAGVEPTRPVVVSVERPSLTARLPLSEVRPTVTGWAAPAPAAAAPATGAGVVAVPAGAGAPVASPFVPAAGNRQTPQPPYPEPARLRGQSGTVRVEFAVTPGGTVTGAVVALSSGFPLLDAAALNTVRDRWQFPTGPARRHYVDIVFQLRRAGLP